MPRMTEKDVTRARPQPGEEAQDHAAPRRQRGIQSIEVGMRVLQALTEQRRALPLKDLARLADMPPAKAHPYLVSFMATGLVKQHPLTGHYELGPAALQMGLAALQQLDPLTEASQEAAQQNARPAHAQGRKPGGDDPAARGACVFRHRAWRAFARA